MNYARFCTEDPYTRSWEYYPIDKKDRIFAIHGIFIVENVDFYFGEVSSRSRLLRDSRSVLAICHGLLLKVISDAINLFLRAFWVRGPTIPAETSRALRISFSSIWNLRSATRVVPVSFHLHFSGICPIYPSPKRASWSVITSAWVDPILRPSRLSTFSSISFFFAS